VLPTLLAIAGRVAKGAWSSRALVLCKHQLAQPNLRRARAGGRIFTCDQAPSDHHVLCADLCDHVEPRTIRFIRSLWAAPRRGHRCPAHPRPRRTKRTRPTSNPLAIHGLTLLLNQWVGIGIPRQEFTSIAGWLLIFGVRLINPVDGPVGEEPGWRGFALPGLQATRSPMGSTAILAVLITVWHLPLYFLEGGNLPASTIVGGIVGPFAFTFMATWLFNHTGGSVLLTILLHAAEGSIQAEGWVYTGLLTIVAIGLVIFDWKAWRSAAPFSATTPQPDQQQELSPGTAT
jgi:Type II CAAX prenyl endopeptidase Rce1-like